MRNRLAAFGALSGALAVMIGAFGAHGLKGGLADGSITQRGFEAFQTGADYHLIHAALLFGIGLLPASRLRNLCGGFIIAGMVLFSGSLYIYGVTALPAFAMITPLGGVSYIAGWLCLAVVLWQHNAQ